MYCYVFQISLFNFNVTSIKLVLLLHKVLDNRTNNFVAVSLDSGKQ